MITNTFYLAMLERLITSNNIGLQHFDKFNQQLDMEEEELPFNLPAAFLEMPENIPWRSVGRHKMLGECNFNIIVLVETYNESDSNAPAEERTAALNPDDVVNDITALLVGFSGVGFGTISKTGTALDHDHGSVKEWVIPFKTLLTDVAAKRSVTTKRVNGNLADRKFEN